MKQIVFAVLGDVHGQISYAAELIRQTEQEIGQKIDFILQTGDLEAHRNENDLKSMYAPYREKRLGDFTSYLNGEKSFPRPLYFIGGNHESYRALEPGNEQRELAPNILFLGRVGVTTIQGITIAFLTGIYDEGYYYSKAHERQCPDEELDLHTQRFLSCYVEDEVKSLALISQPDILLVHEWPGGIVRLQDHESDEPKHRHLRYGETGIPVIAWLVEKISPQIVVCGHLHRSYRGDMKNRFGHHTMIYCLSKVDHPDGAIMIFTFDGFHFNELLCKN